MAKYFPLFIDISNKTFLVVGAGNIAARRSEINLDISDKYESYLGRDFLQPSKIEALQKLINDKEASNLIEAIDLYQRRQNG